MSDIAPLVVLTAFLTMFSLCAFLATRFKRCAPDQLLVVYGRVGPASDGRIKVIHHGGILVFPLIQSYRYLSLAPVTVVDRRTQDRLGVVQISADPHLSQIAVERLLSLTPDEILDFVTDIFEDFDDEDQIRSELQKSGIELVRYSANKAGAIDA